MKKHVSIALKTGIAYAACWPLSVVADWQFTEVSEAAGVAATHGILGSGEAGPVRMSGGVAVGDYDGDGDPDLYLATGDASPNKLFRNNADGTFSDATNEAGVGLEGHLGAGPAFADIDMDGDLDLTVGNVMGAGYRVFRNDGAGAFTDISESAGFWRETGLQNDLSTAFGDPDGDGDLDAMVSHWGAPDPTNHLWLNMGEGNFVPGDQASGITTYEAKDWSFSPVFTDINGDGHQDLLVASDFGYSHVLLNQGNAVFEVVTDRDVIDDQNGMGHAAADFDNDGDIDWFVTSIYDPAFRSDSTGSGNKLYQNDGSGTFRNVTQIAGIEDGGWGWGACAADLDNDHHLDIFHVNGYPKRGETQTDFSFDPSKLFHNNGNRTFSEISADLGLLDTAQGRGVTCFDYDLDGDIDLFIANYEGPSSLWRNDLNPNPGWLQVKVDGSATSTQVAGAIIEVITGALTQTREITIGSNFESQNPLVQHFGLGGAPLSDGLIDEVRVRWPYGGATTLVDVSPNQLLIITPDMAEPPPFGLWPGMTASWFDTNRSGEGFALEMLANGIAVAYFFTYGANGEQDWYVMVGTVNGNRISFPRVQRVSGGVFGQELRPNQISNEFVGSAGFTWFDDNSGKMDWFIDGVHGRMELARITELLDLSEPCEAQLESVGQVSCPSLSGLTGSWFDPSHYGEGFALEMLTNGQVVLYWFTYGPNGERRWFVGVGEIVEGKLVFENMMTTRGPRFGADYDPDDFEAMSWGRVEMAIDCEGGTVTYQSTENGFGAGTLKVLKLTTIDGLACPVD